MAIISLTSIPPRFGTLGPVLASLRAQTARIDEIRLYLPRRWRRFAGTHSLPASIGREVRVIEVEDDLGPATKVLCAMRDLSGTGEPILFCDDDRLYPPGWADGLLRAHATHQGACIAVTGRLIRDVLAGARHVPPPPQARLARRFDPSYRLARLRQQWAEKRLVTRGAKPARSVVDRAGHVDLLEGYGGALVLPEFADDAFWDIPETIWMVDDIWLSGHLARRGIPIWLPAGLPLCRPTQGDQIAPLRLARLGGMGRQEADHRAITYFQRHHGLWL